MCAGPVQYRITEREHQILQSAATCAADLDPSYCFAGRLATPQPYAALGLPSTRIVFCMACTHSNNYPDSLCMPVLAQALRVQDWRNAGQLWRWVPTTQ